MASNANSTFSSHTVTEAINGPLYRKDGILKASRDVPHLAIYSYQTYDKQLEKGVWGACTKILGQTFKQKFLESRTEKQVMQGWERRSNNFDHANEKACLDRLSSSFEETMGWTSPPVRFLIFGLPSLFASDGAAAHVLDRQHLFTCKIVDHLLERLYSTFSTEGRTNKPQIIVDCNNYTIGDRHLVKGLFEEQAKGLCTVHMATEAVMLDKVADTSNFVLMFNPKNPLRQAIADYLQHSAKSSDDLPWAVLCAPWSVDNKLSDDPHFDGDRSSTFVRDWLENYKEIPATDGSLKEGDLKVFGTTVLHLYKRTARYTLGALQDPPEGGQGESPMIPGEARSAESTESGGAPARGQRPFPDVQLIDIPVPPPPTCSDAGNRAAGFGDMYKGYKFYSG